MGMRESSAVVVMLEEEPKVYMKWPIYLKLFLVLYVFCWCLLLMQAFAVHGIGSVRIPLSACRSKRAAVIERRDKGSYTVQGRDGGRYERNENFEQV
jgi:hypothetical protein